MHLLVPRPPSTLSAGPLAPSENLKSLKNVSQISGFIMLQFCLCPTVTQTRQNSAFVGDYCKWTVSLKERVTRWQFHVGCNKKRKQHVQTEIFWKDSTFSRVNYKRSPEISFVHVWISISVHRNMSVAAVFQALFRIEGREATSAWFYRYKRSQQSVRRSTSCSCNRIIVLLTYQLFSKHSICELLWEDI